MWSEVVETYRATKKKRDINWFTEWICRPQAAFLVYFLRRTPITPNQVTFLSFALAVGAGALFVRGPGHLGVIAAAVVLQISYLFDCADGQLARVRKTTSHLGHLLDFLMDELKAMLILGCVAVRVWLDTGDTLFLLVGMAGLYCLASGLMLTSFTRRPEYGAKPPTEDGQPATMRRRTGLIGGSISLFEWAARWLVHYPQYIWIAALADRMDVFLWLYGGVNALYLSRMLLVILVRLGRFRAAEESS